MPKTAPPAPNFEDSLQALETIVKRLEAGELSLADSLEAFEEGVKLTKNCQALLDQAELKIQTLGGSDQAE